MTVLVHSRDCYECVICVTYMYVLLSIGEIRFGEAEAGRLWSSTGFTTRNVRHEYVGSRIVISIVTEIAKSK